MTLPTRDGKVAVWAAENNRYAALIEQTAGAPAITSVPPGAGAVHARLGTSGRPHHMLKKNPLCPPLPYRACPAAAGANGTAPATTAFVSAEDYDGTGILAGVDPCESRYWWLPELISACGSDAEPRDQATSRSRPATAIDA